jgi:outer membrane protein OmpA-like peptidoglycan-associated protein
LGDLVLTPKAVLLDRDQFPIGIAVSVPVSIPTGDSAAFLGEGSVSVTPQAVVEWSNGKLHTRQYTFRAAAMAGALVREPARLQDTAIGHAAVYGAALGFRVVKPLELNLELHGNSSGSRASQNAAELLLGAKVLVADVVSISAGGGTGLGGGVGSPDFRVYFGATVAPNFDSGLRDTDRDHVPDRRDKCPEEAEDVDKFQDEDGCPDPDNDQDTVLDVTDRCPNEAGPVDNQGCPPVFTHIQVTQHGVRFQVEFDYNRATLRPSAAVTLDEVVAYLGQQQNRTLRYEVGGHTSSEGARRRNQVLSADRAETVRRYLTDHGIDPSRLTARGYGPSVPIASNRTEQGRQANRRVELNELDASGNVIR